MELFKELGAVGLAFISSPINGFKYAAKVKSGDIKNPSVDDFVDRSIKISESLIEGNFGSPVENAKDAVDGVVYIAESVANTFEVEILKPTKAILEMVTSPVNIFLVSFGVGLVLCLKMRG